MPLREAFSELTILLNLPLKSYRLKKLKIITEQSSVSAACRKEIEISASERSERMGIQNRLTQRRTMKLLKKN
jgi:hypothetical protein